MRYESEESGELRDEPMENEIKDSNKQDTELKCTSLAYYNIIQGGGRVTRNRLKKEEEPGEIDAAAKMQKSASASSVPKSEPKLPQKETRSAIDAKKTALRKISKSGPEPSQPKPEPAFKQPATNPAIPKHAIKQ